MQHHHRDAEQCLISIPQYRAVTDRRMKTYSIFYYNLITEMLYVVCKLESSDTVTPSTLYNNVKHIDLMCQIEPHEQKRCVTTVTVDISNKTTLKHSLNALVNLPTLFTGFPRICNFTWLLIVLVQSFSKMYVCICTQ